MCNKRIGARFIVGASSRVMFCSSTDEKLPLLLFPVISNCRGIKRRRGKVTPLVDRVYVEEEIFDFRGENIANWGNLASVLQRRGNIAEILGRQDLAIKLS